MFSSSINCTTMCYTVSNVRCSSWLSTSTFASASLSLSLPTSLSTDTLSWFGWFGPRHDQNPVFGDPNFTLGHRNVHWIPFGSSSANITSLLSSATLVRPNAGSVIYLFPIFKALHGSWNHRSINTKRIVLSTRLYFMPCTYLPLGNLPPHQSLPWTSNHRRVKQNYGQFWTNA